MEYDIVDIFIKKYLHMKVRVEKNFSIWSFFLKIF